MMKRELGYFLIGIGIIAGSCEEKQRTVNNIEINTNINTDSLNKERLRYTTINNPSKANLIADDTVTLWNPTLKQVDEVMAILRETLESKEIRHSKYLKVDSLNHAYKQLICYKDKNGDSLVYINGMCRIGDYFEEDSAGNLKVYRRNWQNRMIEVMDGGDCYWQALINYSKKKSLRLSANGEA